MVDAHFHNMMVLYFYINDIIMPLTPLTANCELWILIMPEPELEKIIMKKIWNYSLQAFSQEQLSKTK